MKEGTVIQVEISSAVIFAIPTFARGTQLKWISITPSIRTEFRIFVVAGSHNPLSLQYRG